MADETKDARSTRKEFFKSLRREAYEKAKERRKSDPRQIALKEEMKVRRRDAYLKFKERRRVASAEFKQAQREKNAARAAEHKAKVDARLRKRVTRGPGLE